MTAPIYLTLVIHNHQPVGQFDEVNAHVTAVCYEPLTALKRTLASNARFTSRGVCWITLWRSRVH